VGSSVKEVLDAIERVAGRPVPHEFVDRRAGDPVSTFADTARSREVLDWTPKYGLDEIVTTAYRWHEGQLAVS
jgi:UDP-glucose 4-epimerase